MIIVMISHEYILLHHVMTNFDKSLSPGNGIFIKVTTVSLLSIAGFDKMHHVDLRLQVENIPA